MPEASVADSVVVLPSRVGLSFAAARPLMGTSVTETSVCAISLPALLLASTVAV